MRVKFGVLLSPTVTRFAVLNSPLMKKTTLISGTTIAASALVLSHFPPETCERDARTVFYACAPATPEALHTHDGEAPAPIAGQGAVVAVTSASAVNASDTWGLTFGA